MKQLLLLLNKGGQKCLSLYLPLFLFFSCSLWACSSDAADKPDQPSKEEVEKTDFPISKGLNIGCWLSQSSVRGEERAKAFTETDVKKLASYGFDHLRLPVDEEQLFKEDGTMDMETMQLAHNVIKWCRTAGMRVIFDLHIIRSHYFGDSSNPLWNDNKEQEKLLLMWKNIAKQLEQYPVEWVAYEPLNEPVAANDYQWNALAQKLIKQFREINNRRVVVLGANRWSGVDHVKQLSVPAEDPNLILEFHFYEPYLLTHYQASWTAFAKLNMELHYPGKLIPDNSYSGLSSEDKGIVQPYNQEYSKATILKQWQSAIDFAKSKGLKLYCGEFGCLPSAGNENRLAWTKEIVKLCKENGIAYSYWEYNSIFGFADKGGNVYNQPLLDCLVK